MFRNSIFLLLIFLLQAPLFAGEGMWLPFLLKQLNEAEMQSMGMKMSAEDIYSVNKGSLKDAIVQFGGGCTGEIISSNGLLLTNHHCGYSQIQRHSSLENNYVDNGFWAMSHAEELPNQGLTAMFVISMAEVTDDVNKGVTSNMTESQIQGITDKNIDAIKKSYPRESYQDVLIRSFYKGNKYYLFVTETYRDIRLVGAPPSAIGNFGVDSDNWVWPRHTGDFSLFRVYADKNNRPAEFSEDNVPFKPRHYLPISMSGIESGDFTMVFGFPGSTNEYLPSESINQITNLTDPIRIAIRTRALDIMYKYMQNEPATKIKYVTKSARISNGWKKWQGEMEGLKRTNAYGRKQQLEKEYQARLTSNPTLKSKYGGVLEDMQLHVLEANKYVKIREYSLELLSTNIESLRAMSRLRGVANALENNGSAEAKKRLESVRQWVPGHFKDFDQRIDEEIFVDLFDLYHHEVGDEFSFDALNQLMPGTAQYPANAARLFSSSMIVDETKMNQLVQMEPEKAVEVILKDPLYQFYMQMLQQYNEKVAPNVSKHEAAIESGMKIYMAALMEVFPEKRFYPDANSTMRITYGKVDGYQPRDAVYYDPQTYLDGVIEKYIPGNYEFDLPPRLLELYEKKDFGPYTQNGKVPVCFIASNHTTGGNSGSPAIDAHGNLIGLNFDRTWEGTMSDYNYDASICRNIMVDIRYILFIIDKYAGAKHLIDEMKLVYPKGQKG